MDAKRTASFVILIAFAHFSHHVLIALLTPLLPFIRDDFSLTYAQSGMIVSAFTVAYGISQVPSGWVADRIGARLLVFIGISGVAIAGALVGLSNSYLFLMGTLFLVGIAGGAYHPAAAALIADNVPSGSRGRVLGLHIIGGSTSYFLAPLIAAGLVAALRWRGAFLTLSAPVFFLGIAVFAFQKRHRSTQGEHTGEGSRARPKDSDQETVAGDNTVTPERSATAERPQPVSRIVVFLIFAGAIGAVSASVIAYIPLFLVDAFGVDGRVSAAFLSILFAAGLFAAPLGGMLSDRVGSIWVMVGLGLLAGLAYLVFPHTPFGIPFAVLLLMLGIVAYVKMPSAEAFIADSVPSRMRGIVLGVYFFSGVEGSALLTPVLGTMIDRWGFERSFHLAGLAMLAVTVCSGAFFLASRARPSYSR